MQTRAVRYNRRGAALLDRRVDVAFHIHRAQRAVDGHPVDR
ncbi:hypothetical protein PSNTI_36890 [Stutzerimonas stutzeri]|nr:hypothetical protein PSNTI_36890 [Stutzerimonas stutzeri]